MIGRSFWGNYLSDFVDKLFISRNKRRQIESDIFSLIHRVRKQARINSPPTDLISFARQLDATITYVKLAVNGRVLKDYSGDYTIEINDSLSEFDKIFILAHEITHIILLINTDYIKSLLSIKERDIPYDMLEHMCDIGASDLLLPRTWIRDNIRHGSPSISDALSLATDFSYDLSFILQRFIDIGWWHCRILMWEQTDSQLIAHTTYPNKDNAMLAMIEPLSVSNSLPGKCLSDGGIVNGTIHITSDIVDDVYDAECIKLNANKVLSLLIYSRSLD